MPNEIRTQKEFGKHLTGSTRKQNERADDEALQLMLREEGQAAKGTRKRAKSAVKEEKESDEGEGDLAQMQEEPKKKRGKGRASDE